MPAVAPMLAEVAQMVADPGRANILSTLMDGHTEAACRREAWPAPVLPTGDAADCPDAGRHDDGCRLRSAALPAALADR